MHNASSLLQKSSFAVDFPRRAPARGAGASSVPIRVALMRTGHAMLWDRRIQPFIAARADRADRMWSWTALRTFFPLAQFVHGRRCVAHCVFVRNNLGQAVPAAMSLLIETYPHLVQGGPLYATFAWFLSTAPDTALAALGVAITPSLGRTCIDIAITSSFNAGHDGRIGLHAAPAGGERLIWFYEEHCGLLRLTATAALPVPQANDGRFFYADSACAARLAAEFTPWR